MSDSRIVWQNASPVLMASIQAGSLDRQANGGVAYEYHSVRALEHAFRVGIDGYAVRRPRESMAMYWARMWNHKVVGADLVVKDPRSLAFGARERGTPTIAVIHHVDYDLQQSSLKHRWYFGRLLARLPQTDVVVTVSQFWRRELERAGCRQVEVIYNAFDPSDFEVEPGDLEDFRARHGLPSGRPLIYIGNASKIKGVEEVYEVLKDEGYTLVMSGRTRDTEIPVRWFDLPRDDYVRLLAASDVVVCMSRLLEGWNRVAHEAMLCGTPVIGSGAGGMRELLEGGHQTILADTVGLAEGVRSLLNRREAVGEAGRAYAAQFDAAYFKDAWANLARRVLETKPVVLQ